MVKHLLMMILKFILIFSLTFSTFDSAIFTKFKTIILHTKNTVGPSAGTTDPIIIKVHSEHNSQVKTVIVTNIKTGVFSKR